MYNQYRRSFQCSPLMTASRYTCHCMNSFFCYLHTANTKTKPAFTSTKYTGASDIIMSSDDKNREEKGSFSAVPRKYFLPKELDNATPEKIWSWWQAKRLQEGLLKNAIVSGKVSMNTSNSLIQQCSKPSFFSSFLMIICLTKKYMFIFFVNFRKIFDQISRITDLI